MSLSLFSKLSDLLKKENDKFHEEFQFTERQCEQFFERVVLPVLMKLIICRGWTVEYKFSRGIWIAVPWRGMSLSVCVPTDIHCNKVNPCVTEILFRGEIERYAPVDNLVERIIEIFESFSQTKRAIKRRRLRREKRE